MPNQVPSLLSGDEIKSRGLIANGIDAGYRATTYDLTIGEMFPSDDRHRKSADPYLLHPGGMVRVVSRESLNLSQSVSGQALPKNALCNKGILAINVGVIDPGFCGPISSTLINFGKEPLELEPGTAFLRLTFPRCHETSHAVAGFDRTKYIERVRLEVQAYSGSKFLSVDKIAAAASKRVFGSMKRWMFAWAGFAAVLLGFVAILAPVVAAIVDHQITDRHQWEKETAQVIEKRVEDRSAAQLKSLADEVQNLRLQIEKANLPSTNGRSGGR